MKLLGHKAFPMALWKGPHFSEPSEQLFISGVQLTPLPCPRGGCAGFVNLQDAQTATSHLPVISMAARSPSLTHYLLPPSCA